MKLLLVLILLSLSSLLLQSNATTLKAVRDTAGRNLRRGSEYYILPVIRGRGGGLSLADHRGNNSCPLYVSQESSEVRDGLPLSFSPVNPSDKVVRLSTDLNVQFAAVTICVQSTVWRLGDLDEATGRRYVVTGGVKGNPGLKTVSNWFKVERYGGDYKLVFCPGVCSFCKVLCGDVGVFNEGGRRWLGLSDAPFPVMFKSV